MKLRFAALTTAAALFAIGAASPTLAASRHDYHKGKPQISTHITVPNVVARTGGGGMATRVIGPRASHQMVTGLKSQPAAVQALPPTGGGGVPAPSPALPIPGIVGSLGLILAGLGLRRFGPH
ncbi:MAG: hypothetical protein ACRDFS_05670 [Chloroflexota bacterium]